MQAIIIFAIIIVTALIFYDIGFCAGINRCSEILEEHIKKYNKRKESKNE